MKFKKKPVVIEAFMYGYDIPPKWFEESDVVFNDDGKQAFVETLEGDMKISFGDWVIKGVMGEIYPCKPDIFEKTYEPA